MAGRAPQGPPPPPVLARVRLRYAKRGRLRFCSHRDFARAFERALRRAGVPMAYSAGFTPRPKISYLGAAPTGAASEAEYLEIGLAAAVDIEVLRTALDAALPDGLDIIEAVPAGSGSLADRIEASQWRLELPGATAGEVQTAVEALLERDSYRVERVTKTGRREVDVRAALVRLTVDSGGYGHSDSRHAILEMVVRQVTPAVRPDDVLAALRGVAGLALASAPVAVRVAQGPLDSAGKVGDPLSADRG